MDGTVAEFEVVPLSDAIGTEIRGVDLRHSLDSSVMGAIEKAWLDHVVILFRGQELAPADQERFARYFGELEAVKSSASQTDDEPHIMFISNVRDAGLRTALEDGDMWFHSDQCYYELPASGTTLYAIEVPPKGGNTLFSNGYTAYESLPEDVKRTLDGKLALNIYDYQYNAVVQSRVNRDDAPRFVHPAVRVHPLTARKALFVNRLMTDHIVDMDSGESRELLDFLFDHMERPEFVYEHVWRPGDLLMWDNRCSTHARTHFEPTDRRMLRRIAVKGDKPF